MTGWLTLRQARAALQSGRLHDALQLLHHPAVQGHKRAYDLHRRVAFAFAQRGERHLRHDAVPEAWADLHTAESLVPADPPAIALRQTLTRLGLAEVRGLLEAGEPVRAAQRIAALRDHGVPAVEMQGLEDAAKDWLLTVELAERGEFGLAAQMFERAGRMLHLGVGVARFRDELARRTEKFAAALPLLHVALDGKQWRDVVLRADEVLAAAPQHAEARKARARAWNTRETEAYTPTVEPAAPVELAGPAKRFHLWIDGAGGYLVCLGTRVTLGQAAADATADVPLLADISRVHATLSRDSEGYLLESNRPLTVNGQPAARQLLQAGDRIVLGGSCPVVFERPVPVSASARLDLGRGQRMPLSLDGVLLMADTLVIGPGAAHVSLPDLDRPVILYRAGDGLGVRCAGPFRLDGQDCAERAALPPRATVSAADFRLAVEPAAKGRG